MKPGNHNLSAVLLLTITAVVVGITVFSSAVVADSATVNTSGPNTVDPGETVSISITVTNTASDSGSYIANISPPSGWRITGRTDAGGIWNQEDRAWLWQQISSNNSVVPSVMLAVPPNASSGSYTITTNTLSKDGVEATAEHEVTISGADSSNSTNGAVTGGRPTPSGGERTADASKSNVTGSINSTPEGSIEAEIEDAVPQQGGVTVQFTNSSVSEVTFDDEYSGSITVTQYNGSSSEIVDQIARSFAVEADSGERGDEIPSDGSRQIDSTVSVVSLTDISPSSEAATQAAATVQFTVDRDQIANPENVVVVHRTDNRWEQLETKPVRSDSSEVTLEAATDSFSLFAVVEMRSEDPSETEARDVGNDPSVPMLPVVGIIALLLLSGTVLWLRR